MKLAICLSGQLREFKRSYPSLKKNILDVVDCDIFAYVWEPKKQPHFDIEGSIRYPDEGSTDEFRDLYNPTVFCKEIWDDDREKFFDNPRFNINRHPHASVVRYQALLYMAWSANQRKNEYCHLWNKEYDAVIKYRSDIEILNPIRESEIIDTIDNSVFYADVLRSDGMVSDMFWLANNAVMNTACGLWDYFVDLHDDGTQFNTEIMFPAWLKDNGIVVKQHSMGANVLRPPQAKW
jgi:hypothetical protein